VISPRKIAKDGEARSAVIGTLPKLFNRPIDKLAKMDVTNEEVDQSGADAMGECCQTSGSSAHY